MRIANLLFPLVAVVLLSCGESSSTSPVLEARCATCGNTYTQQQCETAGAAKGCKTSTVKSGPYSPCGAGTYSYCDFKDCNEGPSC